MAVGRFGFPIPNRKASSASWIFFSGGSSCLDPTAVPYCQLRFGISASCCVGQSAFRLVVVANVKSTSSTSSSTSPYLQYSGGVSLYAWCRYSWVFMLLKCGAGVTTRQVWSESSHGVTRPMISKNWTDFILKWTGLNWPHTDHSRDCVGIHWWLWPILNSP